MTNPNPNPRLAAAKKFAEEAHQDQQYGRRPFINHPLRVMGYLFAIGYNEDLLCAALLHDVVEKTDVSSSEIHEKFGARVGELVDLLTLDPDRPRGEQLASYYERIAKDADATLLKVADRLAHLSSSVSDPSMLDMFRRYRLEHPAFRDALHPDDKRAVQMWEAIDLTCQVVIAEA